MSNFYADKITDFCLFNDIKPAVNQIELHPFFQKVDEQKINNDLSVAVQSWASFAEGQNGIFENELLSQIGKKYGKTPAQVILRWLIERNVIVIPKTTRIERMRENFAVFDFALSADDKAKIATLDTNKTLFFDHRDPERIKWLANYKVWALNLRKNLSDKSEKGVKFSFLTPFKVNLKAKFKGNKCQ